MSTDKKKAQERRAETDKKFEELQASFWSLREEVEHVKAEQRNQKKKVGFLCKGQFVVVEGSEALEYSYKIEVEDEKGDGYGEFVARTPYVLVTELAEHLGLRQTKEEPCNWDPATEAGVKAKQDCQTLKDWYAILSAPRALINVQPQYQGKGKGKGKGKDKGKKGKKGNKGKGKGKDKSQKSGRTRKPEVFVLQLAAGLRCLESRSLLEETLENRLREECGLKVTKRSRPLVKKVGATAEGMEVDDSTPAPAPVSETAAAASPGLSTVPGAVAKKRLLVYVEKTAEEKEAKKGGAKGGSAPSSG